MDTFTLTLNDLQSRKKDIGKLFKIGNRFDDNDIRKIVDEKLGPVEKILTYREAQKLDGAIVLCIDVTCDFNDVYHIVLYKHEKYSINFDYVDYIEL